MGSISDSYGLTDVLSAMPEIKDEGLPYLLRSDKKYITINQIADALENILDSDEVYSGLRFLSNNIIGDNRRLKYANVSVGTREFSPHIENKKIKLTKKNITYGVEISVSGGWTRKMSDDGIGKALEESVITYLANDIMSKYHEKLPDK